MEVQCIVTWCYSGILNLSWLCKRMSCLIVLDLKFVLPYCASVIGTREFYICILLMRITKYSNRQSPYVATNLPTVIHLSWNHARHESHHLHHQCIARRKKKDRRASKQLKDRKRDHTAALQRSYCPHSSSRPHHTHTHTHTHRCAHTRIDAHEHTSLSSVLKQPAESSNFQAHTPLKRICTCV